MSLVRNSLLLVDVCCLLFVVVRVCCLLFHVCILLFVRLRIVGCICVNVVVCC